MIKISKENNDIVIGKFGKYNFLHITFDVIEDRVIIYYKGSKILARQINLFTNSDETIACENEEDVAKLINGNEYGVLDPVYTISQNYLMHEQNGVEYFRKKRAELVFMNSNSLLSNTDVFIIEEKLKDVKNAVISGDWMTASYIMSNNVVVGVSLTQEIYDGILSDINNYISNNY